MRTVQRSRGGPRAYCKGLQCAGSPVTVANGPTAHGYPEAVTRPLIQVNTLEGLLDKVKSRRNQTYHEGTRVWITMTQTQKQKAPRKKKKTAQPDY